MQNIYFHLLISRNGREHKMCNYFILWYKYQIYVQVHKTSIQSTRKLFPIAPLKLKEKIIFILRSNLYEFLRYSYIKFRHRQKAFIIQK